MTNWYDVEQFARERHERLRREAAEAARARPLAPGCPPRERLGAALAALARRLAPAGGEPAAGPPLRAGGAGR
jgi:hypothetical protein